MSNLVIDCLIFQKNKAFGFQEFLFNLLDSFYRNRDLINYNNIVIICDKNQINHFQQYSSKFIIYGCSVKNKLHQLFKQNRIHKLLNLNKNDLILFPYNYSPLVKCTKTILVVHDLLFLRKKFLPNFAMRMQRKLFIPISLRKADKIVAISNFTSNDIKRNFNKLNEEKINVIYNYFNFEKFDDNETDIISQKPYILSVSTFSKHKNTIFIFKLYNEICKRKQNFNLVLVGSKNRMNLELKNYYDSLDANVKDGIIFMEKISNHSLASLYLNCRFFISATLFEGLGMPIVEALYFNTPTLLSDIDICREVSLNSVIYFNPDNVISLIDELEKYNYKLQRPNIQDKILDVFSEKNTSIKYIELINSMYNNTIL